MQDPTTKLTTPAEIVAFLDQFIGTESYYRHLFGMLLTDGARALADTCRCHWLMDLIVSYQPKLRTNRDLAAFQVWEIQTFDKPDGGRRALVTCRADSGVDPAVTQSIDYTDFPLDRFEVWVEGDVILLPSEH